ncbi:hypothetical protein PMI15_01229 [Polaromonas sp. CF318]|jgi:multidrug efflux pump subunit AcrA (membrane-fusion protein)|uniref:hypothetical protein n=1 Tax=Polaromonas sp. CF318 TaxID=1144318 RepID=UPI000270DB07|nr:hypothetical protein [Polaromonas sp. CF318]EJL87083.1 hypothetical protein PMI15_01229 [Polaromonas sp. CF318]
MSAFHVRHATSIAGWVLLGAAALAGCAGLGTADPAAQRVTVEGRTYLVSALTAGTWTATSQAAGPISTTPAGRAALLQAIEQHSGCKVTDVDYSRGGMQLDAQVDCASRLKN